MSTTRSEKILRKKSTNFSAKMVLREWSIKWPVSKRSSAFATWRSSLPKSEHAPPPRDRGSRCHDLNSNRCRRNISGRRIQKFLYPGDLGAGRFAKIGIPAPDKLGPLVGGV